MQSAANHSTATRHAPVGRRGEHLLKTLSALGVALLTLVGIHDH
jgi:hypothetical protein